MTDLCACAAALLSRHYPEVKGPFSVSSLGGQACRLSSMDGERVLKRHAAWVGGRRVLQEELLLAVARAGLGPEVEPSGPNLFVVEDGEVYSLQRRLSGAMPGEEDAELAGRALAELHGVLAQVAHRETPHHMLPATTGLADRAKGYGYGAEAEIARQARDVLSGEVAQLVHGDPHPANMVLNTQGVHFIDFDSAHLGSPAQDAAFAAFRLTGGDGHTMGRFIVGYGERCPETYLTAETVGMLSVRAVLTRLVFILSERDRGEARWMVDLDNQQRYLASAMQLVTA